MQHCVTRNPVVVLGGNLTALGVIRAFGRRGIHAISVEDSNGIAHFSRYCKRSLAAPLRRAIDSLKAFWRRHNQTILLILLVATATILVTSAISTWLSQRHNIHFPSLGTIHTIGVKAYGSEILQNELTEVQWGTIYTGTSNNATIYIQSTSNVKTILELETANWTFVNTTDDAVWGPCNTTDYMNLTWNNDSSSLNPHETIQVTLTLYVDNSLDFVQFLITNHITKFYFDIVIRANPE